MKCESDRDSNVIRRYGSSHPENDQNWVGSADKRTLKAAATADDQLATTGLRLLFQVCRYDAVECGLDRCQPDWRIIVVAVFP